MADLIFANGAFTGAPTDTSPPVLTLSVAGKTGDLVITSFMDFDANMTKDTNTWTQMDRAGKRQVPTTSTNTVNGSMILNDETFFGITADVGHVAGSAAVLGIEGLVRLATRVSIEYNIGSHIASAEGYVIGANPKATSDSARWETPVSIIIDGDVTWS